MGLFLFIGLIVGVAIGSAIGWWRATRPELMRQRQDKESHETALQVLNHSYTIGTNRSPLYVRGFDQAQQEVEGVIEGGRSVALQSLINDARHGVLRLEMANHFDPSNRRHRMAASFQLLEHAEVKKVGYQLKATVEQLQSWIPRTHREEAQKAMASMFFDSSQVAAALAAAREANLPSTDVVDEREIHQAVDEALRNHHDTLCMEPAPTTPRETQQFPGVRPVLLPQGKKT